MSSIIYLSLSLSSELVYLMPPGAILPEPSRYGVLYVKQQFGEEALGFNGVCNSLVGLLPGQPSTTPNRCSTSCDGDASNLAARTSGAAPGMYASR